MGDSPDYWLVGDENGGHIEFDRLKVMQAAQAGWTTIPLCTAQTLAKRTSEARADERRKTQTGIAGTIRSEPARWSRFHERDPRAVIIDAARVAESWRPSEGAGT